jgi:hypothetical protein
MLGSKTAGCLRGITAAEALLADCSETVAVAFAHSLLTQWQETASYAAAAVACCVTGSETHSCMTHAAKNIVMTAN